MNNSKITPKERNLIKGAIRRVFSRTELRRQALECALLPFYSDPKRPRVTKWTQCNLCKLPTPAYKAAVDHLIPVVPIESSLEEMTWDELIDRMWCDTFNLQVLCEVCHNIKTKAENKARREFKKRRKKNV